MPRFHSSRFNASRFDATAAVSTWPAYLRQEYPLQRVVAISARRESIGRVTTLQRHRQRPLTAWVPHRNQVSAQAVMKVPWVFWTIRGRR